MKRTILQFVVCSLLLAACLCSQKAYAICDEPTGTGAVFNNFDRIVIYFASMTHPDQQKIEGYPEILKSENLKRRVELAVRSNFSECLRTKAGQDKKIVLTERPVKEIFDRGTLTITFKSSYMVGHQTTLGIEEYGSMFFSMYRPNLSEEDSFFNHQNHTGFRAIFPKRGEQALAEQIDGFLKRIRPIKYPMHLDNREDEFWNNLWKNQK